MTPAILLALALCGPASAGKGAAEAESQRIAEEMRQLSERNHWEGVDDQYRRLLALRGATIGYDEHWLGAQAAAASGDVDQTYQRLQRALKVRFTDEALQWSATLLANHGEVYLQVRGAPAALAPEEFPLDPQQRHTVELAVAAVAAEGSYRGLLPLGRYTLGDRAFEVVGGPEVKVVAR